nr:hypothetical protein BaRGS_031203 [Batillaria attramentaria]
MRAGIGHDIQRRLLERLEREKTETVRAAEEAVWEEAEKRKASALQRVRDEGVQQIQQQLEEERKMHEQHVKEECLKVEMAMQKQAIEQVQEERAKAEKQLKEAVERVEARCAKELKEAVAQAKQREQEAAAKNIVTIVQKHAVETEKIRTEAMQDKAKAITALTVAKDEERANAVAQACERERKIATEKLDKMRKEGQKALEREYKKMVEMIVEIEGLKVQIQEVEKRKERVSEYLMVTRQHFQDYIDRMKAFYPGQADYMLPPAYLDEIERGLMVAK